MTHRWLWLGDRVISSSSAALWLLIVTQVSSKVSATHLSVIMSLELEWDAESTSDVQDVSMTQTSATPSTDADLPKNIEGKRCNAFSITDTCTWVHHLAEPFTEADKNFGITKRGSTNQHQILNSNSLLK